MSPNENNNKIRICARPRPSLHLFRVNQPIRGTLSETTILCYYLRWVSFDDFATLQPIRVLFTKKHVSTATFANVASQPAGRAKKRKAREDYTIAEKLGSERSYSWLRKANKGIKPKKKNISEKN